MLKTGATKLLIACCILLFGGQPSARSAEVGRSACLQGLGPALLEGGYSGGTDCTSLDLRLSKIGSVHAGGEIYVIYSLIYKTKPEEGTVAHGGQKVLVFSSGAKPKYLGQYALSPPPNRRVQIAGSAIRLVTGGNEKAEQIPFGKDGPPAKVLLDGYVVKFEK